MPAFIDHVVMSLSQDDNNPVKKSILQTVARITESDSPKHEGGQSYGALCRIFDSMPLTLDGSRFRELQEKYLLLMNAASQKTSAAGKNSGLRFHSQEFLRELLKECSQEIMNPNGELNDILVKALKLDAVDIDPKLKSKALVFSFVHTLQVGISESIRDLIMVNAAKKHKITVTNKKPLDDILAAANLPEGTPARKAADAAWKAIGEATEKQRVIDKEVTDLLNIIQTNFENPQDYVKIHKQNIFHFIQNYVLSGHTKKWNDDFVKIFRDPAILLNITASLSIFSSDTETIGDVLLQYIAKNYPEETRNAVEKISTHEKVLKNDGTKRLAKVSKLIPAEVDEKQLHSSASSSATTKRPG
jgi:hypothetical protein